MTARTRALQVNGLRQERVVDAMCPGFVSGTNSYDARTLCGNWSEERCDKAYRPSEQKASKNNDWQFGTSTQAEAREHAHKVLPARGSNSLTPYTHPASELATGQTEASTMSNSETIQMGFAKDPAYTTIGDARSASRPYGNYVNYQTGKQTLLHCVGGQRTQMIPYETTSVAAFSDPVVKRVLSSAGRVDTGDVGKPHFQLRDPARDSKAKMLCSIKRDEYGWVGQDERHIKEHVFGFPVANKQKGYTLDEYRRRWTRSAPEIAAAGAIPCSEQRAKFIHHDMREVEDTKRRPGHIGTWH